MRAFCPVAPLLPRSRHVNSLTPLRRRARATDLVASGAPIQRRGAIICPGKFDSFHLGHLALARAAADLGRPVMLSFSGMAETLGWPPRAPVVAPIERDGILRGWAAEVGKSVAYKALPFSGVRSLTPREFVQLLVDDLGATGLVCGSDWKFGYRASGDVEVLREIAEEMEGFEIRVVEPVVLDDGVVSSTAVREAIGEGDIAKAKAMMGRPHRVVGLLEEGEKREVVVTGIINQVPGDGTYQALVRVLGRREPVRSFLDIQRPNGSDPMQRGGEVKVVVSEGELMFCSGCEVYVDFEERVS